MDRAGPVGSPRYYSVDDGSSCPGLRRTGPLVLGRTRRIPTLLQRGSQGVNTPPAPLGTPEAPGWVRAFSLCTPRQRPPESWVRDPRIPLGSPEARVRQIREIPRRERPEYSATPVRNAGSAGSVPRWERPEYSATPVWNAFRESALAARKRLADVRPILDKGEGKCHSAVREADGGITRPDPRKWRRRFAAIRATSAEQGASGSAGPVPRRERTDYSSTLVEAGSAGLDPRRDRTTR